LFGRRCREHRRPRDRIAVCLGVLFTLAALVPTLSLCVRRLHDLDRAGWWLLLFFAPVANFALVVWWCMRGTDGYNRFGPDYFRPGGYISRRARA
jgi:uncharacterized membrane protein YhaH (DUF805 family)